MRRGKHSGSAQAVLSILLAGVLLAGGASAPSAFAEEPPRPPGRLGRQIVLLPEPVKIPEYAFAERKPSGAVVDRAILDFEGRLVLLNFWATWCGVCRKEMPKLDALAGRLATSGLPVDVLALSIDDEIEEAGRALAKRGHARLRVFHDSQVVLAPLLGVRGVPTTFVVDPRGRAIAMTQGPADWDSDEAMEWLRALAGQAPGPAEQAAAQTAPR